MPAMPVQGTYLVADDDDSADAWMDAVLLVSYIVRTRSEAEMSAALQPPAVGRSL